MCATTGVAASWETAGVGIGAAAPSILTGALNEKDRRIPLGLLMCSPDAPRLRIEEELEVVLAYPEKFSAKYAECVE